MDLERVISQIINQPVAPLTIVNQGRSVAQTLGETALPITKIVDLRLTTVVKVTMTTEDLLTMRIADHRTTMTADPLTMMIVDPLTMMTADHRTTMIADHHTTMTADHPITMIADPLTTMIVALLTMMIAGHLIMMIAGPLTTTTADHLTTMTEGHLTILKIAEVSMTVEMITMTGLALIGVMTLISMEMINVKTIVALLIPLEIEIMARNKEAETLVSTKTVILTAKRVDPSVTDLSQTATLVPTIFKIKDKDPLQAPKASQLKSMDPFV